ncbi:hypothetical protein ACIA5C_47975 [Actinoplanes sp. NPDC051343]|uniref:hypothetical protein n=1 Tax=Actinoplanes sp. NPDC051343 TaxID=3363906 RepID=UPI003792D84C
MSIHLDRNRSVSHVGLRTRGLNRLSEPFELAYVVEFEEIPPGMLDRVLVVSAICSLITLALAFVMPSALRDSRGTDVAAFLLAVPIFAATVVGISPERARQSSWTTVGGLITSGTISLTSSVVYIIPSLAWRHTPVVRLSVLGLFRLPAADTLWLLLAVVSIAATVSLGKVSVHPMNRYRSTLRTSTEPI